MLDIDLEKCVYIFSNWRRNGKTNRQKNFLGLDGNDNFRNINKNDNAACFNLTPTYQNQPCLNVFNEKLDKKVSLMQWIDPNTHQYFIVTEKEDIKCLEIDFVPADTN